MFWGTDRRKTLTLSLPVVEKIADIVNKVTETNPLELLYCAYTRLHVQSSCSDPPGLWRRGEQVSWRTRCMSSDHRTRRSCVAKRPTATYRWSEWTCCTDYCRVSIPTTEVRVMELPQTSTGLSRWQTTQTNDKIDRFYRPILSTDILGEIRTKFYYSEFIADKIDRYNRAILSVVCHTKIGRFFVVR